jgi:excisionase family DNA binding protein
MDLTLALMPGRGYGGRVLQRTHGEEPSHRLLHVQAVKTQKCEEKAKVCRHHFGRIPGPLASIPSHFRHLYMSPTTPNSPWMNAREAAQYLRVAHRTLVRWARSGRIPAHRLSGTGRITWRFLRSELDGMLCASSRGHAEREAAL